MSSTSAMNPTNVLQHQPANNHPHDEDEFPALSPNQATATKQQHTAVDNSNNNSDDWELLAEDGNVEVTTRSSTVVRIVEPSGGGKAGRTTTLPANWNELKHCSSSPDLRHLVLDDADVSSGSSSSSDDDSSSAVLVDASNDNSVASSSVVVVPAPAKSSSVWGGGVSFKDTLLKDGAVEKPKKEPQPPPNHYHHSHHKHKKRAKKQSAFVVKPIPRSAKSTGDLQRLALIVENEGEILGATDAQQYYDQKSQGVISKKNGLKLRPDEYTRLKMTMNRKNDQRRQQGIDVPDEAYLK